MKKKAIKKVRAIVFTIKNNKPYFLILHRILRWKGWEFLKETIEPKETIGQTVKRGIKEETGIKDFKIIKKLNKKEKWQAKKNNYEIVNTFLIKFKKLENISLKQKIKEHDKYEWVKKEDALKKLTWPKTKAMLKSLNIKSL